MTIPVAELLQLSAEEKLRIIETLWDDLSRHPDSVPISEEWKAELERRKAEWEQNPVGSSWEEVKERIRQRRGC
jgi:putative addiction module component (TIGR02574 family)